MSFGNVLFPTSSPGTSTPPPHDSEQFSPSLNEEVKVVGQLGGFGGASGGRCVAAITYIHFPNMTLHFSYGFKGSCAIQAARDDLGDYDSQAQRGLKNQLSTTPSASSDAPTSDAQSSIMDDPTCVIFP
jgi:hypothetical protein